MDLKLTEDLSRETLEANSKRHMNEVWSTVYCQGVDDGLDLVHKLVMLVTGKRHYVTQILKRPVREASAWLSQETGAPLLACRSVARTIHSLKRR